MFPFTLFKIEIFLAGTVFGLCQTVGAAGLLAANYVVSEGLHGSVSTSIITCVSTTNNMCRKGKIFF